MTSLVAQMVKSHPAMQETWIQSLGWEDPLRRAWQPTPIFLTRESPWTQEPGGLQSMRLQSWTGLSDKHIYVHYTAKSGIIVLSSVLIKLRHREEK